MFLFTLAIIIGFALLVWSADKFVDGAASTAKYLGMPSLLIGVLIVGFGTSTPEMVVSAIAAINGNSGLALGNAIGSNIVNIALILGITAIITPISVHSKIVKKELPILTLIVLIVGYMLIDNSLTFFEGFLLICAFFSLIGWSIYSAIKDRKNSLTSDIEEGLKEHSISLKSGFIWLGVGLILLILSSRVLVWGAIGIAHEFGVSDLIIGLTIVAFGTSLPELASSVIAAKKGEHDIALGNIVGSNMFNMLAVIGIATVITPMQNIPTEALYRDWSVMFLLTVILFVMTYKFNSKERGVISRVMGVVLLLCYIWYNSYLTTTLVS